MANHDYTKPGGVWPPAQSIPMALLADLDWKSTSSLSALGGVYAFDDDMIIGGSTPFVEWAFEIPVTCSEQVTAYAGFVAYGDVTLGISIGDSFTVEASSEFNAPADFNSDVDFFDVVYFRGDVDFWEATTFHGPVTVEDELAVDGLATFAAEVTFEDSVIFEESVTLEGQLNAPVTCLLGDSSHSVQLNGSTLVYKPLRVQSGGAIAQLIAAGDDSTTTYSPLTVREVIMESGVLSSSTTFTINDSGCFDGMDFLVTNHDESAAIDVKRPGGATLTSLAGRWARFVRCSGVWVLAQRGPLT